MNLGKGITQRAKGLELVRIAGDELTGTVFDASESAKSVVFQFENIVGMVEGSGAKGEPH